MATTTWAACINSATTSTSYDPWINLCSTTDATSTITITNNTFVNNTSTAIIWTGWCEETERVLSNEEQQHIVADNQRRIKKETEAKEKAEELLKENLNKAQRKQFKKDRSFIVYGGTTKRRYRIRDGDIINIDEYDSDGNIKRKVCAHPVDVPIHDKMLTQKLMLQYDEEAFLRIANYHA